MKKTILGLAIAMLLIASVVIYQSCYNASASSVIKSNSSQADLHELGFINVPKEKSRIQMDLQNFYRKKTGLKFLSDDSVAKFIRINGLIISEAQNFKSEIPDTNRSQIIANYAKLKQVKHYYFDDFFQEYHEVGTHRHGSGDPLNRKGVMVVAPAELFNDNAFTKKDPIVLVKVDGGWLELSRW